MTKHCQASGCHCVASGWSNYCARHKATNIRHGHPEQRPVSVHELRPFIRRVRKRYADNPTSQAWVILTDQWTRLVRQAQRTLDEYQAGRACVIHAVKASQLVVTLAGSVSALATFEAYAAMDLLAETQPHRFKSDRAFDFQLFRRVRGLTSANAGTYYDHKSGKTKRVYRDVAPRTIQAFVGYLKAAFGSAGIQLARLEGRQADELAERQQQLSEAIRDMG